MVLPEFYFLLFGSVTYFESKPYDQNPTSHLKIRNSTCEVQFIDKEYRHLQMK